MDLQKTCAKKHVNIRIMSLSLTPRGKKIKPRFECQDVKNDLWNAFHATLETKTKLHYWWSMINYDQRIGPRSCLVK